jgi:hypothetical protein
VIRWFGFAIFLTLTVFVGPSRADFSIAPRYEYIAGNGDELANRLLIKSKLSANFGYFGIYFDGFGEFDANKEEAEIRRSPNRGYLQEGYLEFKKDAIYIRVGRQAMRWSDMWIVPSLDIWTARRWNRLYFDPVSEQLIHSTGLNFSYATQSFSLDLVGIADLAQSTYPEPLPETLDVRIPGETSGGARIQFDVSGFHFSTLGAKQQKKYYYGLAGNYAFDSVVPKFEAGMSHDTTEAEPGTVTSTTEQQDQYFGSVGLDLFLGNWVLTPQVTVYDFGDLNQKNNDYRSVYYISGQRKVEPHDFQFMGFVNTTNQDAFWSLTYSYNLTNYFSLSGFVQEYYGEEGTLHWLYRQITGPGLVAGLRLELVGDGAF